MVLDRLSAAERQALEALSRDPDCYGILRPRDDAALSIKSVSHETALLLFTLQSPSILPQYVVSALGRRWDSVIGQMIFDGILEVEANGKMLSGPPARNVIYGETLSGAPQTALAVLSREALEYGEALRISDVATLSARLYSYNGIPASARWRRLLCDQAAVETHLGVRDTAVARMLDRHWARLPSEATSHTWMAWQSRVVGYRDDNALTYKLYVSPVCNELREAFTATAEAVSNSAAFHWKVGNDVFGLLRPDKIVAHFYEFADLQNAAADILERLEGCTAHGVPFTAEIAGRGLLSWGVDPPAEEHTVRWLERESWRGRICNLLARALSLSKTSPQNGVSASQFAMERARLEGIDTDTWSPTSALAWRVSIR
ncbi:MAG: hypothetical protein WB681_09210 [Candidatus Cybelea sp.]